MRKILGWILGVVFLAAVGISFVGPPEMVRADDPSTVPLIIKASAPTVNDDALDGIKVGTVWLIQSDGRMWMCRGNAPGAASWKQFDSVALTGTSGYYPTFNAGTATVANVTIAKATIASGTVTGVTVVPVVSTPSFTSGVGFSIDATTADVFLINPASSVTSAAESDNCSVGIAGTGVTVVVAAPTSATDGKMIKIINTTGTTPFVVRVGTGLPVETTSGTTPSNLPDAAGDNVTLMLKYNSSISGFVVGEFIQ